MTIPLTLSTVIEALDRNVPVTVRAYRPTHGSTSAGRNDRSTPVQEQTAAGHLASRG